MMGKACISIVLLTAMTAAMPVSAAQAAAKAAVPVVASANALSAQSFVKDLADKAFAVLRDTRLAQADREAKFRQMLRGGFALDLIGQSVLGAARRTATPAQMAAYNKAFPEYVLKIYANRLTDYSNTTLKVTGSIPAPRGDLLVRTVVSGKQVQQPVHADWRVRAFEGQGYKIVDLQVEGISMTQTQRDEFAAKIQVSGMDGLIAHLEQSAGLR